MQNICFNVWFIHCTWISCVHITYIDSRKMPSLCYEKFDCGLGFRLQISGEYCLNFLTLKSFSLLWFSEFSWDIFKGSSSSAVSTATVSLGEILTHRYVILHSFPQWIEATVDSHPFLWCGRKLCHYKETEFLCCLKFQQLILRPTRCTL